jgi:8-oxo-dGTP diphosphatase
MNGTRMIKEIFAIPCVGVIIEKVISNEKYILIHSGQKEDGNETNGMIEIPAGKFRGYEKFQSLLFSLFASHKIYLVHTQLF